MDRVIFAYLTFLNVFGARLHWPSLPPSVSTSTPSQVDFSVPGYDWKKSLHTIHRNDLWMQFYDYDLDPNVGYAGTQFRSTKTARILSESSGTAPRTRRETQVASNGSSRSGLRETTPISAEAMRDESRLSDVALDWMLRWAAAVPNGLKFDDRALKAWPYPNGLSTMRSLRLWLYPEMDRNYLGEEHRPLPGKSAVRTLSCTGRFIIVR